MADNAKVDERRGDEATPLIVQVDPIPLLQVRRPRNIQLLWPKGSHVYTCTCTWLTLVYEHVYVYIPLFPPQIHVQNVYA